jgi:hypothetical protein
MNRNWFLIKLLNKKDSSSTDQQQQLIVTGLPPPGRLSLSLQQQQQPSILARPSSYLNTSESMSSLKSIISNKSANSGGNYNIPVILIYLVNFFIN